MAKKDDKKSSVNRQVFEITPSLASNLMPLGTKYMFFDKKLDLEEGVEVVAKTFSGMRRGVITAVTDNGLVEINESATFVNDVLYRII